MAEQQDVLEQKPKTCQAQGCEVDVNPFGRYCKKRRLCPEHLKAPSLRRKKFGDEKWRFCQQCGKLELLTKFDGLKRSCRVQLARRRAVSGGRGSAPAAAERRRSNAADTDKTSSEEGASERLSDEGNNAAAIAAAAAAAAAAGAASGIQLHGFGAAMPAGQPGAAAGLPSGVDLAAAIMQQELDNVLNAQLLQQQQLQQQQEMFGLQQQQQQHQQQQQRQGALQMAAASPAAGALSAAAASMTARSVAPTSGEDLLLQLLREQQQQLRGWQQLQPGGLSGPDAGSGIADVYSAGLGSSTVAAEPLSGFSTGIGRNPSLDSMRAQQQQQQQQQLAHSFQHSGSQQQQQQQQAFDVKREPGDDLQSFPKACHSTSGSSGSMNASRGPTAAAADAGGHMGPGPNAFSAADTQQQQQQQQQQQPQQPQQQSSMALMQDASGSTGLALAQMMMQQQQQQQQQQLQRELQGTLDPFFETALRTAQQPQRSRYTPLPEFEALEEMLAAAAAAAAGAGAGAPFSVSGAPAAGQAVGGGAGGGGGPSELCSLRSPDTQSPSMLLLLDPRGQHHHHQQHQQHQQHPQLRAIDSAPARLMLPGDGCAIGAAVGQMPTTCVEMQQGLGFFPLPGSSPSGPSLFPAADHSLQEGNPQDNPPGGSSYGAVVGGAFAAEKEPGGAAAWQRPDSIPSRGPWVPDDYSLGPSVAFRGGMRSGGMLPDQRTQQQVQGRGGTGGPGVTQQLQISRQKLAAELQALLDSTR